MRNLISHKLLYLVPSNYAELEDEDIQIAIKKYSTIDLPESVLLENLELVVEEYSKTECTPSLSIFFYGKDMETNNEILLGITSETLYHDPHTITPTLSLMVERWKDVSTRRPLRVTRIGFCKFDEELSITISVRLLEAEDKINALL
jgi:hypothetical protein